MALAHPPDLSIDHNVLTVGSPARTIAHDSDSPCPHDPDSPDSEKSLVETLMNAEDATSLVVSVLHFIIAAPNAPFILDFSALDGAEKPTSPPPTLDELLVHRQTSLRPKAQEDIISTMEYQEQGNRVLQQLDALGNDVLARGIVQDIDFAVSDDPESSTVTVFFCEVTQLTRRQYTGVHV
uniref:Uncharacterized protein n=1 Tax=Mycena chlorophos TaxID=658473 RepID=A0ABQ0M3M5_MYCCL|nr:predicted protein [Mycena chlorophos]